MCQKWERFKGLGGCADGVGVTMDPWLRDRYAGVGRTPDVVRVEPGVFRETRRGRRDAERLVGSVERGYGRRRAARWVIGGVIVVGVAAWLLWCWSGWV